MAEEKRTKQGVFDLGDVRKLIDMLEKSSLEELEMDFQGVHLRLKKPAAVQTIIQHAAAPAPAAGAQAPPLQQSQATLSAAPQESLPMVKPDNVHEVKCPMVGTFYRSPAPNAEPFVKAGDTVRKGQTLCIVEAMKLMNEIECEVDGKVLEIKVQNADPVEYGEVLMVIETGL